MRGNMRGAALALATATAVGCSGGRADGDGWRAETDTIGDTVVVRTLGGSAWGDSADLVEEVRVGSLEGADAYVLGEPVALAVDRHGGFYVVDSQVPVVRAYRSDGTYRTDIGREGGGPGEYQYPDGVAVLRDGRIAVRDPGNGRIDLYSPEGEALGDWPHPTGGAFRTDEPFYVDSTGVAYVTTLADVGAPPWEWSYILIGLDSAGGVVDTVPAPAFEYEAAVVRAARENSQSVRRVPFTPEEVWAFAPGGYMVGAVTGAYRITLFRADAPPLRIERDSPPLVPVGREEAAERVARITEGIRRSYGDWRWNGPAVPSTKPPLRDLFVDEDGRIWVVVSQQARAVVSADAAREEKLRTNRTPIRFEEPPAFDVFDARGRFLGPVRAPASLRLEPTPVARGDSLWGVVRDSIGVPAVVRFRIRHDRHG